LDFLFVGKEQIRFSASIRFRRGRDARVCRMSRVLIDFHGLWQIGAIGPGRALSCSLHAYHMLM
jgi:hypothetical protein